MILLENRIALMTRMGSYFTQMPEALTEAIDRAYRANGWFTPEYIRMAIHNIATAFLEEHKLQEWLQQYPDLVTKPVSPKTVGLVMAGNIPLVGFHDFLCVFLSGHRLLLKLSSKDTVLWQHILQVLTSWDPEVADQVQVAEMLKGCDAYIATGSDNSSRYFEYYFQKYPHIIRKNRTSVAVLDGSESKTALQHLSDDINLYFGLGCRNVTQLYVPKEYNFEPLLEALEPYKAHIDHHKFKNNYDYQLALFLLNKQYYMSNGHVLLVEHPSPFAPISVVHYTHYEDKEALLQALQQDDQIQCVTLAQDTSGPGKLYPFGANQCPTLTDYADGVDTMAFLEKL